MFDKYAEHLRDSAPCTSQWDGFDRGDLDNNMEDSMPFSHEFYAEVFPPATTHHPVFESKLVRAKRLLGERYVLHPNYFDRPRHSVHPEKYRQHSILYNVQVVAFNNGRIPAITIET